MLVACWGPLAFGAVAGLVVGWVTWTMLMEFIYGHDWPRRLGFRRSPPPGG